MQECDPRFFPDSRQAIVQRIQISAIPAGKRQFLGQCIMDLGHGFHLSAVNDDVFHLRFPIQQFKTLIVIIGVVDQTIIGENNPFRATAVFT